MAKLQTIPTDVIYDSRDYKKARIVLEMGEKTKNGNVYIFPIKDYAATETITEVEGGEPIVSEVLTFVREKNIPLEVALVDGLYASLEAMIPEGLSYTEKNDWVEEQAFLIYVQNDFIKNAEGRAVNGKCIYNLNPSDFEIRK